MIGELPRSLSVSGRNYAIRSDYRYVLRIAAAFADPELEDREKVYICLWILYRDFDRIPKRDYEAAFRAALAFIDHDSGENKGGRPSPRIMDWEQDEALLLPAINKVAGREVRGINYLHWWTFLGYYSEITEGTFATVLALRSKKARGKPLEKWEAEYWNANKDICRLRPKLTAEEQAAKARLEAMLG